MRCSSRSTVLSSNRWTTLAQTGVLVVLSLSVVLGESDRMVRVERAIADAVRATMGDVVRVDVTVGQIRLSDAVTAELEARPAPGARLGRRTRFTLYRRPTGDAAVAERVGYAVAEANATIMHLRTARPIKRGTIFSVDDLIQAEADVGSVPLKPLPTLEQVVGATAKRHLTEGALVSSTVVRPSTLVRTGDLVLAQVRVGAVVVAGRTTALQSGQLGDVIGLVNEQSGQRIRGRVVAPGEVEVVH